MVTRAKNEVEWGVFLLRKKAQLIGHVHAKDAMEAIDRACEKFNVTVAERFRISVQQV